MVLPRHYHHLDRPTDQLDRDNKDNEADERARRCDEDEDDRDADLHDHDHDDHDNVHDRDEDVHNDVHDCDEDDRDDVHDRANAMRTSVMTTTTMTMCDHGCHGSDRDVCPQGQPGVARPSDTSAKNIGRKECRESRRKHVDRSDGSGQEYWRIGRTHQITCRLEISVLITGLDMIG